MDATVNRPAGAGPSDAQLARLARLAVEETGLDLAGLTVLTEAATGVRRLGAGLAALAGAEAVYAVARHTAEAARGEAEAATAAFAAACGLAARVTVLATRLQAPLHEVDVVLDLPGVRPVDESVLRNLAATGAVALTQRAALWRRQHVDVAACRRHGVAVAGLDEEAAGLWQHLGAVALRGLAALDVDAVAATVVVAGDGAFYAHAVRALAPLCRRLLVVAPDNPGRVALHGGEKVADDLAAPGLAERLAAADALVLCSDRDEPSWLAAGQGATMPAPEALARLAPHLAVVAVPAARDLRALASAGLRVWPDPPPAHSPWETVPRAFATQVAAALKVGAAMSRARRRGSSPLAAEQAAAAEACADLLPKDLAGRG